ncbi:MAG: lysophospholipid acyltransferase family protein [Methylophilaceae bacterium]
MRTLLGIYDILVMYLGLFLLGLECLAWTPFALVAYPLLSLRRGRALGRYIISRGFRLYLTALEMFGRATFDLKALDELRSESALILAPNHPCLLDAVMVISRLPNVACVMKTELMNNVFLGAGSRLARYIPSEPVRSMIQDAARDFECDSQLLLFPEGTRTTHLPVNRFKGSIGIISKHAKVPVQTILIETDTKFLSKGWSLFRKPILPIHYRITLGKRFDPPENTQQFMTELEHYFTHALVKDTPFRPVGSLSNNT